EILKCLGAKNIHGLRSLNADERLIRLAEIRNNLEALSEFDEDTEELMKFFSEEFGQNFRVDFSTVNNLNYYNGLVFRGFVEGLPEAVLSGGQYDGLLEARGLAGCHGVGFAVNLSLVRRLEHD
ncbi:MAG: ATP phosphoribosyltransferase regulatory subunit, partial [Synergistaceae bacterium]|nr:ATP phosphoribosyltransferase regulatory subunit [Synergistaceae bacterium]